MIRAEQLRTGDTRQRAARVVGCACALTAAGAMLWGSIANGAERPKQAPPQPWVTISLGSLGVPSIATALVKVGSSMLTLDVVDDTHLLVTFSLRGLVPRLPGDPPDHDDRMVRAEVVELPSGKIVATKDWHMHDHGRYLWRLGKGRFLVRSGESLFVITPKALLATKDPLSELGVPSREGMPVAAVISPDKDMLTVETMLPKQKAEAAKVDAGLVLLGDAKQQVALDFYRVIGGDETGQPLTLKGAGVVRAQAAILLPMDSDGYLWPDDPQRGRWPLSFNEFGGREVKIGAVDSSCAPRLQMVSRFEFLAFTCMGTDSRTKVKAYGMDGHETWEDSLGDTYGVPEFAFAPAAGRFAISRISSSIPEMDEFIGEAVPDGSTQEVRVYQTESGDLLLKAQTTPVTRFAENFDLSEDGLVAALVNDGAIEVYKLRPPSKQDLKDLEQARGFSPPVSEAPVNFAKMEAAQREEEAEDAAAANPQAATLASAPKLAAKADAASSAGPQGGSAAVAGDVTKAPAGSAAAASAGQAADGDAASGDSSETKPRKPPTLLEPGETVDQPK